MNPHKNTSPFTYLFIDQPLPEILTLLKEKYRILVKFHCYIARITLNDFKSLHYLHDLLDLDDLETIIEESEFLTSDIGLFEIQKKLIVVQLNSKNKAKLNSGFFYMLFGQFKMIEKQRMVFFCDICVDSQQKNEHFFEETIQTLRINNFF